MFFFVSLNSNQRTAICTLNTPPNLFIVSLILSIAPSKALSPSTFSGVDVVITGITKFIVNSAINVDEKKMLYLGQLTVQWRSNEIDFNWKLFGR